MFDLPDSSVSGSSISERSQNPPVIDYEGSGYRTDFWEGQGRNYEDAAERLALKRLLPASGRRIAEIGAGFGRLADLYLGYEQIILFDYSRTLLQEAVVRWGDDPRFVFVAGNIYQLSLAKASLDSLVMVRVMHHLANVPGALHELRRTLHDGSVAVLEYANKRNLKALMRWAVGRQSWSPVDVDPVEFVELNFDFHPAWMWEQFVQADLSIQKQLAVSHLRIPLLKQTIPPAWLAQVDSWLFGAGGRYPLSPSVFVQARATSRDVQAKDGYSDELGKNELRNGETHEDVTDLFACPVCRSDRSFHQLDRDRLECANCRTRIARRGGIWDFKEPVD